MELNSVGRVCRGAAVRTYASVARRKRVFGDGPRLGLDHFVQRSKALALWREIVRATNKLPKGPTRDDLRLFARQEFERNKGVTDITQIRYLISTGKTQFDSVRRYVEGGL